MSALKERKLSHIAGTIAQVVRSMAEERSKNMSESQQHSDFSVAPRENAKTIYKLFGIVVEDENGFNVSLRIETDIEDERKDRKQDDPTQSSE